MSKINIYTYENNPEWNHLEVAGRYADWSVNSYMDGDVEIECSTNDGSNSLILNQEELKQFIQFLQTKVK